ncbi:MAG TPA: hypothetical protein VK616_16045, partial [Flavitalea sp.]|nr:hypothetical protein [Flavitalea sp.]
MRSSFHPGSIKLENPAELIPSRLKKSALNPRGEIGSRVVFFPYIQLQQDYLTAKAQFAFNESEFNRQKELNLSKKAISDKVFEQTRATYQTQNVFIRSLEEKLKLIGLNPAKLNAGTITRSINVYSPINGFVSTVNVNIGKYVTASD